MCKSLAEGGQRCASHTRTRLADKADAVEAAVQANDIEALRVAQSEWETAAAEYASTDEGHQHLSAQAEAAHASGDLHTAALLNTVVRKGEALRAANRETAALLAAVRLARTAPDPDQQTCSAPSVAPVGAEMAPVEPSGPVVPDLSPAQRKEWAETIAAFEALGAADLRITRLRGVRGTYTVQDLVDAHTEFDQAIGDPASDDDALAMAAQRQNRLRDAVAMYPETVFDDPNRPEFHAANVPLKDQIQKVWHAANHAAFSKSFRAQYQRMLAHPGAGERTYRQVLTQDEALTRAATKNPRCPVPLLNAAMRADNDPGSDSDTSVHPDGWARARDQRMGPGGAALALTLAAKDPDTWQRAEAVNQVIMTPLDDFSETDRAWLVANLHQIPGSANQETLARSVVAFANGYADDAEKARLRDLFTASQVTEPRGLLGDGGAPRENRMSTQLRYLGNEIRTSMPPVRQQQAAEEAPKKRRLFGRD